MDDATGVKLNTVICIITIFYLIVAQKYTKISLIFIIVTLQF